MTRHKSRWVTFYKPLFEENGSQRNSIAMGLIALQIVTDESTLPHVLFQIQLLCHCLHTDPRPVAPSSVSLSPPLPVLALAELIGDNLQLLLV